ncbi:acetone carboxylase subunit gamma [Effusibacillus lacus]|uniref:Acetone carboxylase subunit gamma n=1 Tax=Effusibacillus lacus TaxID=1348429 RepID=A0A292YNP4_9BACL|nr:acetone carboxylase subunit gamma [Effusibacillus lacus]TCS70962.1 acetone carboxylase gamma subunit [Effusibacillus lacus]GAX90004.1 acetone carboxylase subunit gamma [Effusibacillus lacus]
MSESIDKDLIRQLLDGTISDDDVQRLQRMPYKDADRFWQYLEVLQDSVPWDEKILLRLNDHLYVVRDKSGNRIVKCDCGHEYGDYRINWKLQSLVRVRKTLDEFKQVYSPEPACPEPEWQEIREFYCPNCVAQLAVEVVPPGYPIVFEMLPDLDRFYRDFLGKPLEDESSNWYEDRSEDLLAKWGQEVK